MHGMYVPQSNASLPLASVLRYPFTRGCPNWVRQLSCEARHGYFVCGELKSMLW